MFRSTVYGSKKLYVWQKNGIAHKLFLLPQQGIFSNNMYAKVFSNEINSLICTDSVLFWRCKNLSLY